MYYFESFRINNSQKDHHLIQPKTTELKFCLMKGEILCIKALICLVSYYDNTSDSRKQVDNIYLDLRKAFDSVPLKEHLFKLLKMELLVTNKRWFKNYLTELHYLIFLEAILDTSPVLSGFPQGTIIRTTPVSTILY